MLMDANALYHIARLIAISKVPTDDHVCENQEIFSARCISNSGDPITVNKTPGRNDSCSCGSGKKYKRCCMSAKS